MQADLLGVSRSSLYYQPRPPGAEEVQLKHRIDEVYTAHPYYGYRKITAQLQCVVVTFDSTSLFP